MSGAYKWSDIGIDPASAVYDIGAGMLVLAAVAAARAAAAAAEETCRMEAARAAMNARLLEARQEARAALAPVSALIGEQADDMSRNDAAQLAQRVDAAKKEIESARNFGDVSEAVMGIERVRRDIARAVERKGLDDARHGRTGAIPALRLQFAALRSQAANLATDAAELGIDLDDRGATQSLIATIGGALQTDNEALIAGHVAELETLVHKQTNIVSTAHERKQLWTARGRQAIADSEAILAGLGADTVVMRWHSSAVESLHRELGTISATVESGDAETATRTVEAARVRSAEIIREANTAQLKADQRDYISQSIARTLEEMGFVVGPLQAEHPEHPATATVIHAATAGGKNISVSVPVDGQVWYNVQGFPKSLEAKVGGGEAAVCDEAETVIEQMHQALDSEFHVQMGELMWDGKDPERKLRAAQSLPTSHADKRTTGP